MSQVLKILHGIRPECDFSKSSDFLVEGLLDSMDLMTLVSALDRACAISIDGVDIVPENFNTLEAIQKLLSRHGVQS